MMDQKIQPEEILAAYKRQAGDRSGISVRKFQNSRDCTIYQIEGSSREAFERFTEELKGADLELYDSRQIRDNLFYTFVRGEQELHTYYTGHDGTVRIIVDESTKKYPRAGGGKKDGNAILYQFELDYRRIDCGMCYIIKCQNGSFFVIDSAHMFSEEDHLRIYRFLRKHTPEGRKIVISGWFLSHAHQDHIVKFMDFVEEGFPDVVLEDIYYNFPLLTVKGADQWKEDDKVTMREFDLLMEKHRELSTVRLHTGQRFQVDNLEFTVLSTHEDLCNYSLDCYNDASTVLMLESCETRVLFLGDANYLACSEMTARYGKALKADMVQVAHHGLNGANVGIYYMADAKSALYATDRKYFDVQASSPSNQTVLCLCSEYFIAGDGTAEFRFPYKAGEARIFPKEIGKE